MSDARETLRGKFETFWVGSHAGSHARFGDTFARSDKSPDEYFYFHIQCAWIAYQAAYADAVSAAYKLVEIEIEPLCLGESDAILAEKIVSKLRALAP